MGTLQGFIPQVMLVCLVSTSVVYSEQDLLPSPENISVVSINLKHILHWEPISVARGNVTYSVQTQGEFERRYMNGSWHEADQCQSISAHHCNVTEEVKANVFYNFRVRSELGDQISAWVELEPLFHRNTSLLIPPKVNLQASGLNLHANIEDYGSSFQCFVFLWKKGKEDEVKSIKTSTTSYILQRHTTSIFVTKVEGGNEYCAQVIAYAIPISKNSSRSDPVCIHVQALNHSVLFIGFLCVFGVLIVLVPLALGGWKAFSVMRYSCFPDEDIPDVLDPITQRMVKNNYSIQDKYEEGNNTELHETIFSQETRHAFIVK
ncbi:interleukin-20 receptor subunit beta [Mixophyes fleayi]|uniref:interleukin-20 receptor subunit beta n=1 Tax=Mixophyes fleayi TaxID=3061075 RepID=UPI003F4D831D